MNRFFFTVMLAGAMTLAAITDGNMVSAQQITMTTEAYKVKLRMAGAGNVTIDWGDGKSKTYRFKTRSKSFSHRYSELLPHNITVTGRIVRLQCSNNQLTGLDVSKSPILKHLDCRRNQLMNLEVSKIPTLMNLFCCDNQLTNLDVSKNIALLILLCNDNQLTKLDVSNNPVLDGLYCESNQLTDLDVSSNSVLRELWFEYNRLKNLDVSNNPILQDVRCVGNQFTASEMDALFATLQNNVENRKKRLPRILIYNNPDTDTGNLSIAENKGWTVVNR